MQVKLSKSEDVKFSSFRPSAFQKYFAFYGLIRTDTAMPLIDFLNLPIRCIYSDFQKNLNSHLVPDCTATVYDVFFFSFLEGGLSGVLLVETGFPHKLIWKSQVSGRNGVSE